MKKYAYSLLFLLIGALQSMGQVRQPGIPFTQNAAYSSILSASTYIPQTQADGPDMDVLQQEDAARVHKPTDNFRIGACVATDVTFPSSGIFTTLNDGRQVWRAQISVPGALALGLYYDKFHLPDGVKYYLSNANSMQLLGAYTSANNPADGIWANEKVQGEVVNLEMDIEPGVDITAITLHVNNLVSFYNAIAYLDAYKATKLYFPYGGSSVCEVNAICPAGSAFANQKQATVAIEYTGGGYAYAGSGTMLNNVRNDGTPYMLTASHVEPGNSTSSSTFSSWMFYFNYETPTCTYTGAQPSITQSITGATFVSRASYDSSSTAIIGDFLLLQLSTQVPAHYGAYLAGWDIGTGTPSGTCVSFHHPSGDVKKVSTSANVVPNRNFNSTVPATHWGIEPWDIGGTEEGSSGSGLFNPSGRLIGDLSGGRVVNPPCTTKGTSNNDIMADYSYYSKFSLNWLYVYQQPSSSASRLKDWLDPDNTGATTTDALAANNYKVGVAQVTAANNTVTIFPSPSTGLVYVNGNFSNTNSTKIEVFNIIGDKVKETTTSSALFQDYPVDLGNQTPGVYIVRLSAGNTVITRKVLIAK